MTTPPSTPERTTRGEDTAGGGAPDIDAALSRLLAEGRARAAGTCPDHERLWDALAAATEGGKRFRPGLLTAAHESIGGSRHAAAVQVGAAIELLHTAFVIHDDVIDGDDVRRGRLNVSGTFRERALTRGATAADASEYALTAGVLAGDLALAASIRAVATCGAPPAMVHRLLDLVDDALHTTAAGELGDVRLSLHTTASVPESLQVAEQKTSAYSFSLPLQAGALLAGADEATQARFARAGRTMGVGFQLVDDLIGVFGDPAVTGKSATSDLRTHKQTPLLAHARATAEWEQISRYLGRDLADDELAEVRRLLTVSGSRRFVEDLVESHLSAARTAVAELGLPAGVLASITLPPAALVDSEVAA